MKRWAAIAAIALALGGCQLKETPKPETAVDGQLAVWHDEQRGVTCWERRYQNGYTSGGASISCVPDWMLTKPTKALGLPPEARQ